MVRENNPDQLAVAARICVSESMQPDLIRTMADILYDQQRFVKENLFGFCLAHRTLFDGFCGIEFIDENGGGPGVRLKKRTHKKA
jgi:hypothetical protein